MSERGLGIGPVGILLALAGVTTSYLACLYGVELEQKSLVAFGAWSVVSVLAAFVVDFLFKFVIILVVLFVGALAFTDHPLWQNAATQAKAMRTTICDMVPYDNPDIPIKDWVC